MLEDYGILISAINNSNENRKKYIGNILSNLNGDIGIYRLNTKKDLENIRHSVMGDICQKIVGKEKKIYIYEPLISEISEENIIFVNSVHELSQKSEIIVSNIISEELLPYMHKVYTRDQKYHYDKAEILHGDNNEKKNNSFILK